MNIERQNYYPIDSFIAAINDHDIKPRNLQFDLDDQTYGDIVDTVIDQEIRLRRRQQLCDFTQSGGRYNQLQYPPCADAVQTATAI